MESRYIEIQKSELTKAYQRAYSLECREGWEAENRSIEYIGSTEKENGRITDYYTELTGTAPDTGERAVRLYQQRLLYLARASRSEKEKGEENDMFFRKWKEKKKKDKEITDRRNELISQYRRECIWYMIKSEMSEEEIQKQDVSADHLMESALREAIKATREMSEEIRRKKRCATESE